MPTLKSQNAGVKSNVCLLVTPLQPPNESVQKKTLKNSALEGKQTVSYFDNDGMRTLLIPSKETNYYPITIQKEDLERLQAKSVVLTEKDRLKILEDARAEQSRMEHESAVRKNELKQFDKKGKMGGKGRLSGLEREARDKANYLLKRAWELRKEDEDDVKKANSLILQAKCQAIRDAQLQEHKLLQREMKEEEKRLNQMMEDDNARKLQEEQRKLEEEHSKRERYITELNQQREEIEAHRLLSAELLIEERRKANEAMFVVMLEELEEMRKKEEIRRKVREELNRANEEIKRAQAIEREEERISELRMHEYMKMRAEREDQLEKAKEAERKRRELEYAKQREMQEKQRDLQAMQDEMNAVRRQEEYEKEWRRKEKEAAKKKLKMEEDCRLAREQQIRDNIKYQAMEIAREKRDYERDLKVQLEIQEKERLLELKRKHDAEIYREQILKQINLKEKERIEERQEKFQEGLGFKAEEAKRKSDLKQILEKKIESLKQHNLPEVYIAQIQRQLNLD